MEEVNINKLLTIDNMKAFSQTDGICWLFAFISILFFDQVNQRSTLKLFKWVKVGDKIIPISSVYRDTTNKKLDNFMYAFLEIVRLTMKISIFESVTSEHVRRCNNLLVALFEGYERENSGVFDYDELFSYEKSVEGRIIKVFQMHSGFVASFCRHYDIILNVNKIDNDRSLYKIGYYIGQHGFGDVGHASSIFTYEGQHYYYDSNISSADISKCVITGTKNPTLKNVLKSCEIAETNKRKTLAYNYTHLRPSELYVAEHACIKKLMSASTFVDGLECVLDSRDGVAILYDLFAKTYEELLYSCANYEGSSLLSLMYTYNGFLYFIKLFMNNILDDWEILSICNNKAIRTISDARLMIEQYVTRTHDSDVFFREFNWLFEYIYANKSESVINDVIIRSLYKAIKEYIDTYTHTAHDAEYIKYFKTLYNTTFIRLADAYKPKSGAKLLSDNSIVFGVILRSDGIKTVSVEEFSIADATTYELTHMQERSVDYPYLLQIQKLNIVMNGGYIVNKFKTRRFI